MTRVDPRQQMGVVAAHMREIDQAFTDLHASHDALEAELAARTAEVVELRRANQELKVQLDGLIAERLRSSPAVSTADNFRHQELADRLATFVKQDLPALLHPLADNTGTPADRQHRAARRTAQALELLFQEGVTDGATLLHALDAEHAAHLLPQADRVCAIADALHDTTVALDNPEGWLLHATPGQPIDPRTQEPWGPCDPDAPIEFPVVPGYRANGRTYFHQLVFTRI